MHRTTDRFWKSFNKLQPPVQRTAKQNFHLLKPNPRHPLLHFKKVGKLWSARAGLDHRALAVEDGMTSYGFGLEYKLMIKSGGSPRRSRK